MEDDKYGRQPKWKMTKMVDEAVRENKEIKKSTLSWTWSSSTSNLLLTFSSYFLDDL